METDVRATLKREYANDKIQKVNSVLAKYEELDA